MIDVIFGRLGGGDNPTFWGVWGCGKWSGMPCLSGFLGGVGVFWGVREGFLSVGDGPCCASLGLSEPLGRRLGGVRGV